MDQYIKDLIKTELQKQTGEFQKKLDQLQKQKGELKQQVYELKKRIDEIEDKVVTHRGEKFYQKQLEKMLSGRHARTKYGFTDVTTDDAIYEIKEWKNYKACFGQLKSYSVGNENKRLCAAFFGQVREDRREEIVELFRNNNMEVYELTDTSEMFRLDNPIEDIEMKLDGQNEQRDEFYNWLDQHIIENKNSFVLLKDISFLYNQININNRDKNKLRKEIEKWILQKYPNIQKSLQYSRLNGIKYRGWKGLQLICDK